MDPFLRVKELEKLVQEKDIQIQKLEQVILKLEALYGISKEKGWKAREDVLFSQDKPK